MRVQRGVGIALLGAGLVVLSCSADRGGVAAGVGADASVSTASATAVVESSAAATRIAELRARFRLPVFDPENVRPALAAPAKPLAATTRPALGAAVATRFEAAPDAATYVRAVLPVEALRGVTRSAHVALPVRASDAVRLEDDTSRVSVGFVLEHVQDAHIEVAGGIALYRGALDGADVVHRVHAEGTEDFVVFETRPAREELSYSVDVSRVAGLRLVSNTLEFLDSSGSPQLRIAPPYVVDSAGARHEAKLAVDACAYDTNPAGPWGRAIPGPGATRCNVRVSWAGIAYPAMVDPAWQATGSMGFARTYHTASVLGSGKVLVAGGYAGGAYPSAELYDPVAGTFSATGGMTSWRYGHTASVLGSGKVLVAGGYTGTVYLSSAELYDAGTGTFSPTGGMAGKRGEHTASVLGSGKVLVAGGANGSVGISSAELYDPVAGTFSATGPMAGPRRGHTSSVLGTGKVLVVGGLGGISSAELYDPVAGTFSATGSLAVARGFHTSSVLGVGKVLVAGGVNVSGGALSSAELYDPVAGTFSATGPLAVARRSHTASVLGSGKVLFAGGGDIGAVFFSSTELYDPVAGKFLSAGSMAGARESHTASVLGSGKVLVAGGTGSGWLLSAELYGLLSGDACLVNGECFSGFCADGRCCNTACGASCDRCDLSGKEGTCSTAPGGNPGAPSCSPFACDGSGVVCPTSCASDLACAPGDYCASNGTCQPQKAQAAACPASECKQVGCRQCASGHCADGFCCDTACNGLCQACAASLKQSGAGDGTCGPSPDGTDPHDDCAASGVLCGADGQCNGGGGCRLFSAPATSCSADGKVCDGAGNCALPQRGATCDPDGHTARDSSDKTTDCSPYTCVGGACQLACTSVRDCVAPSICDAKGQCTMPTAAASDSGCSQAPASPTTLTPVAWLALGLALLIRRSGRNLQKDSR